MKRMSGTQVLALYKQIDADAGQWRNTWEDLARYIHPAKIGFIGEREEGQKKTEYIFDSTALQALDDLGHYLSTALTPNAHQWAKLQLKDHETSKQVEVREWLEHASKVLASEWLSSNFYKMAGECYKDIGCFGTMTMECHEKFDARGQHAGLNFENVYMREAGGIQNRYGEIDVTCREYEKNAVSWYQEFGENAGEAVLAHYIEQPDKKFKFIHCCYPRDPDDVDPEAYFLGDASGKKLPFASVWVEKSKAQVVKEGGFYQPNRIIARWDINTDNIYGHGPGLKALPDIRSLNEAKRLELNWVEKNIDPPMKTTENNIVGDLNIAAGQLTVCRDMEALQELYSNTRNYQMVMLKSDELKASINGIFFSDLIRNEGLSARTGVADYEVAMRMQRAQRILGEAVGGLRNEFLKWVVERSFSILYKAGKIEQAPDFGDTELDVKYVSPLQTAQQAQAAESTALFIAEAAQLAAVQKDLGMEADVLDRIDFDKMTKEMADARNVPASVLRSDPEMAAIRKGRMEARARARQMAEAQQAAQTAKDLGSAVGQDNVTEMVTGG